MSLQRIATRQNNRLLEFRVASRHLSRNFGIYPLDIRNDGAIDAPS
jgi:hypothetical protein